MILTPEQLDTLRHMLGINDPYKHPRPWRNYAAVNPGDPKFVELERLGAVERYSIAGTTTGSYDYYRCTPAGSDAAVASHATIKKSLAARRYHRYLSVSDAITGLTFHEFLTKPEFADIRREA